MLGVKQRLASRKGYVDTVGMNSQELCVLFFSSPGIGYWTASAVRSTSQQLRTEGWIFVGLGPVAKADLAFQKALQKVIAWFTIYP